MAVAPRFHFSIDHSFFRTQAKIRTGVNGFISLDGLTRNLPCIEVSSKGPCRRLSVFKGSKVRLLNWHLTAVGAGLEASITDEKKKNDISLGDVKIVVESHDDDKIQVRVDLMGEETQKAFDDVLINLARTAPPMPGFRRTKGGKTSNVPKSFLLQMLGRDRVTKFLIQEIVSTTIRDYVKKENLSAKNKVNTTQTAEELESAFTPGAEFGFNATIEIAEVESEDVEPSVVEEPEAVKPES